MTHHRRPRAEERAAEIDVSPTALVERIDALERELAETRAQAEEYLAGLQRERAEFQNYKRRTAEEREASLGLAAEGLISKVLALADDFDRAIDARPEALAGDPWIEGVGAIDRKLRLLLESEGVSPIDSSPGSAFDPRQHEAIASVPSPDLPEGSIADEVRRGYRLRDRVIRPALVAVATGGPSGRADAGPDPGPGGPPPPGQGDGGPARND
jgi:molecular chaperone GrpE